MTLVLLVLGGVVSAGPLLPVSPFLKGPYLQNPTPSGITLMWETADRALGEVRYERAGTSDRRTVAEAGEPRTIHAVTLGGLRTGTRYSYRAQSGDSAFGGSFRTAPSPEKPFRLVVWGDNQSNPPGFAQVAWAMAAEAPDLAVAVGDLTGRGSDYELWGREFFRPGWPLLAIAPLYVAIGNHEENAHWFYDFFAFPAPRDYYSFDYGCAHCIVLDVNVLYAPGSAQYEWLKRDLDSRACREARWRLAFFHRPPWSEGWDSPGYNGEPEVRVLLTPLLEAGRVDLAFSGHTHDYERGEHGGTTYIITGGGGGALDHWLQDMPQMRVYRSAHHYCVLDVSPREVHFRSRDVDGQTIDEFTREARR